MKKKLIELGVCTLTVLVIASVGVILAQAFISVCA